MDKVVSVPVPEEVKSAMPGTRCYTLGRCSVMAGIEMGRWHMSIAHPDRLPSWDELKEAWTQVVPGDRYFVLPLPPPRYWLNVHHFCLHLWETNDRWLIAQMIFEATGDLGHAELESTVVINRLERQRMESELR